MKNILKFAILSAALVACGGAQPDEGGLWLGQNEEEIQVKIRPHGTYGYNSNSDTMLGCGGVNASDLCVMPVKKTLKVKFDNNLLGGLTVGGKNVHDLITEAFANVTVSSSSNFHFSEVTSGQDVLLTRSFGACHGTSISSAITDYVCANPTSSITLTEAGAGFPGTYVGWGNSMQVFFDIDDVLAKGTTSTQDLNLMDHCAKAAAAAMVAGVGTTTSASLGTSNTVNVNIGPGSRPLATAGQRCAMASYDTSVPTTFGTTGFCATD